MAFIAHKAKWSKFTPFTWILQTLRASLAAQWAQPPVTESHLSVQVQAAPFPIQLLTDAPAEAADTATYVGLCHTCGSSWLLPGPDPELWPFRQLTSKRKTASSVTLPFK